MEFISTPCFNVGDCFVIGNQPYKVNEDKTPEKISLHAYYESCKKEQSSESKQNAPGWITTEQAITLFDNRVITLNETRKMLGLGRIPAGDQFKINETFNNTEKQVAPIIIPLRDGDLVDLGGHVYKINRLADS